MGPAARGLISLLTPLLIWLGFPGGGEWWPLLFIALVPFFYSLTHFSGRSLFFLGFVTGLVMYGSQLYWLVNVLSTYGGLPIFLAVPALFLLMSYMALYIGAAAICVRLLFLALPPVLTLLAVPLLWVGIDWFRSVFLGGFPWMDLGYGLARVPEYIQFSELFGHHSITFLIVLVNTLAALLIRGERGSFILPSVVVIVGISSAAYYSHMRWQGMSEKLDHREPVMRVGIVQGNIEQQLKWSAAHEKLTVDTYLTKTSELTEQKDVDLVVWPETALPFYLTGYDGAGELLSRATSNGAALLTGAPWYEVVDYDKQEVNYFNSAQLFLSDATRGGSYYKSHLVPFGEYVPLKKYMPFLEPLVVNVGDFSPGKVEDTLNYKDAKMGVLICFESIFPDIARRWVLQGANVLINVSNDAWYGRSSAPYHSMAMTVFRAIETRRAVVRAANTGISAFIDPLGRVETASAIFTLWSHAEDVPLLEQQTFFVKKGYLFAPLSFFLSIMLTFIARFRLRGYIGGTSTV